MSTDNIKKRIEELSNWFLENSCFHPDWDKNVRESHVLEVRLEHMASPIRGYRPAYGDTDNYRLAGVKIFRE